MSSKKQTNSKKTKYQRTVPKKKKFFTLAERRAYWIGVGISAERHDDGRKLLDCSSSAIRSSVRKGYEDDSHKDVSLLFLEKNNRPKKDG